MKENYKTEQLMDEDGNVVYKDGKVKKVRKMSTPGGECPEGRKVVSACTEIVNFFNVSSNRKNDIEEIWKAFDLPNLKTVNYGDICIAGISKLLQSLNQSRYAINMLYDAGKNKDFVKVYNGISSDDWKAIQEIEAVCRVPATYMQ